MQQVQQHLYLTRTERNNKTVYEIHDTKTEIKKAYLPQKLVILLLRHCSRFSTQLQLHSGHL